MNTDHIPGRNGGKLRRIPKGVSGNPKGRPRKGVSTVLSALEAAGHAEVTAEQVRATMGRMLNLSRKELVAMRIVKEPTTVQSVMAYNLLVSATK